MKCNLKKNLGFLFLFSPLLLTTCQKSPTGPQGIEDVYPLAVGNYWVYEGEICTWGCFDSEIREEISGKDTLSDGSSVFVKRKIIFHSANLSDTLISYLKLAGNELREYLDKDYDCQFKILLKFPLQIGSRWSTDSCYCPACPLIVEITDSVETVENIDVPAGNFNDCYRIVTCNCPDYTDTRWAAPNIGIGKFTMERIWGSATYVLKEYRVR